ncbi:unnamed protein product [Ambrosiozyma monospora]|uniref:Unnamed protein product n=1 Tax=Ambrosiozyma monospora TaxID=43982 RepID=A0A9W7DH00_AMBMO|nr:unnamed protein product [Ambrosiozyma monospora]
MSTAPFKNLYKKRKVQATQSKSCSICYKPTDTVLITLNSKDWFYVCDVHLADSNFCDVVYMDDSNNDKMKELEKLVNDENSILKKIKHFENLKEQKNNQFNKFKSYIWSNKKADGKNSEDGKDEKDKDKSNDSDAASTGKDSDMTIAELNTKIKELNNKDLKTAKDEIANFNKTFRKYKLSTVFYKNRLMLDYKKQKRVEQQKKLQDGTLFPSIDGLPSLPTK